ncbi:peptidase S58 [Limnohabitans sp. T6-5]|uniref:P1 family peptidase n=1 Tax=Limnohabitans sp. T6-5 TaxID=1100724 RepID=UPI000D3A7073|nr:P1 family peptidase [Limnohabitans sp. T6-5]PUE11425.1 peptidase S58 [Limnohabitans sp. T6-5]
MTSQNIVNTGHGSLVDVPGLQIGHFTHSQRLTGCTVVLAPDGAVGAVDVRGAAPGTRETDLLDPANLVERVHAVLLSGGSAFGLDAASGVMRWLDEHQIGFETPYGRVPIVPAAVLFDLPVVRPGDSPNIRPDAAAGYAACQDASSQPPAAGNVGAGAGASVGKLFGMDRAMKGGIGHASVRTGPWVVAALIACNAVGDVLDPHTGQIIAGARSADGTTLLDTQSALLSGNPGSRPLPGTNTTIGVVGTNATLSKAQAKRLAMSAHDGLARSIRPAHTTLDGDTLFALATGTETRTADLMLLTVMAAQATALATLDAIQKAQGIATTLGYLPAARELVA